MRGITHCLNIKAAARDRSSRDRRQILPTGRRLLLGVLVGVGMGLLLSQMAWSQEKAPPPGGREKPAAADDDFPPPPPPPKDRDPRGPRPPGEFGPPDKPAPWHDYGARRLRDGDDRRGPPDRPDRPDWQRDRPPGPPDRPDGPGRPGPGRPPGPPRWPHGDWESLEQYDPEMFKLLQQDYQLDRETQELAMQYRQAPADQREALKKKLEESVGRHFEARQQRRSLELKRLEEQLDRLRESIDKRNKNQKEIVNRRVSELLGVDDPMRF